MNDRTRPGKYVQYGIVSRGETEMLITNGRIAQVTVEVQRDPIEVEWDMKYGSSPIGLTFPRHEYLDTSAFQRMKDDEPLGEVITATDADASGITRGIQVEVGGRRCPRCHQPGYVMLYFYSLMRGEDKYRKQTFCLACLEAVLCPPRSATNDQP